MEEARVDHGDRQGDLGRNLAPGEGSPPLPQQIADAVAEPAPSRETQESATATDDGRHQPRAELSLEISRLVARVLNGETVDTTSAGLELSMRYPDAGLTAKMVAEAIDSAAGMVGMIRKGSEAEAPAPTAGADQRASLPDDASFTAALNAELGELIGKKLEEPAEPKRDGTAAKPSPPVEAKKPAAGVRTGLASVVRRAFFRG